jgi:hypothetical protein
MALKRLTSGVQPVFNPTSILTNEEEPNEKFSITMKSKGPDDGDVAKQIMFNTEHGVGGAKRNQWVPVLFQTYEKIAANVPGIMEFMDDAAVEVALLPEGGFEAIQMDDV